MSKCNHDLMFDITGQCIKCGLDVNRDFSIEDNEPSANKQFAEVTEFLCRVEDLLGTAALLFPDKDFYLQQVSDWGKELGTDLIIKRS